MPVSFMVTADEEIGSWASRDLILEEAARAQAVLVLEGAGADGALKSARKGWSVYQLSYGTCGSCRTRSPTRDVMRSSGWLR